MFYNLLKVGDLPAQTLSCDKAISAKHALELWGKKLGLTLSFSGSGAPAYLFCEHDASAQSPHPNIPVFVET
jgi:hypothetical protein